MSRRQRKKRADQKKRIQKSLLDSPLNVPKQKVQEISKPVRLQENSKLRNSRYKRIILWCKILVQSSLWKQVTSWQVIGVVAPLFFATGVGLLSLPSPPLGVATFCFFFSSLLLLWKVLVWLRNLPSALGVRMILVFLIFGSIGVITLTALQWVWKSSADPTIFAETSNASHRPGTVIGGITWSPRFSELRVSIVNGTNKDLSDLDILIKPDVGVTAIGQSTSVPDVSFSPEKAIINFRQELVDQKTLQRTVNPLVLILTNGGYRIRAKQLARNDQIELVLALASIPAFPNKTKAEGTIFDRDYVLKVAADESSFWYGHGSDSNGRIEDIFSSERPIPNFVAIEGRYSVEQTEHNLKVQLPVTDRIHEVIPKILKQIENSNVNGIVTK